MASFDHRRYVKSLIYIFETVDKPNSFVIWDGAFCEFDNQYGGMDVEDFLQALIEPLQFRARRHKSSGYRGLRELPPERTSNTGAS